MTVNRSMTQGGGISDSAALCFSGLKESVAKKVLNESVE